ncbi:MAG: acyl-CoA synthetase (NDP forming) [Parasphingorhabdus sp.]|jgi:acyl-CoA synthetase (NDP forming)
MNHPLDALLKPATIALVGASNRKDSPGNILANLVLSSDFSGKAWPVNPGYESINQQQCYPNLFALPETAEHVVLAVGNERLEQALAEAIVHGAKAATIYSSCILENDTQPPLKERLSCMAREAGMALCGGNGMGFYNISEQLYVGMYPMPWAMGKGGISYIAQSGSAFTALAHNVLRLQFNLCVSSGSEMVTTIADYMDWSLAQEETQVIGLFLETVRDPAGFIRALCKARHKEIPIVVLKVGKSPLAAEMTQTHTGAIAGNHAAYEALFKKYGVIEVGDFGELIATLQLFQSSRRAGDGQLATIQESGGLMEYATDIAHKVGVPFASIEDSTRQELIKHLEPGLKPDNPLDAWGSNTDFENRFHALLLSLMRDPNVAVGMFVCNFRDDYYLTEAFFRVVVKVSLEIDKPLIMTNCQGDLAHQSLCLRTRDAGIPFIDGAQEAMLAVKHIFAYRDSCKRTIDNSFALSTDLNIIGKWKRRLALSKNTSLSEFEAMQLLEDFRIAIPKTASVGNEFSLLEAAKKIGYPVVLKTAQPGISHKSDQAGVVVNIETEEELIIGYRKLSSSLGQAALVSQMIEAGTEIGLGMVNDPQFGPVIMLAAGGVLIEILQDRAVALAPLSRSEANEMLCSLKSDQLLRGFRGKPAGDREGLIDLIVAFAQMCYELRGHIGELDINPVLVNQHQAIAVDALVVPKPIPT